ncbi:MAG: outer membrane lipoprotein chaperone LolA [Ectothiorhodospiraceae bacterium]|nr:outer membrane lipoprotein chaperone LolA [Ectothiorhodospiraceae bacterium]
MAGQNNSIFGAKLVHGFAFFAFFLAGSPVLAAEGMDRLTAFFAQKGGMRAEFVQTVEGAAFAQPDESRGTLLLQRPGKFRWDYKLPYPQLIIADGRQLWIYDVDLEQVIVKPLDAALGDTPALLLSNGGNVSERFEISPLLGRDDKLLWMLLVPKQADSGFKEIRLGFGPKHLLGMELVDGFDQITRLVFSDVEIGLTLPNDSFQFVPPEGVDVVGRELR